MLVALDIETACNVKGCSGKGCDHALIPHLARITCIGVYTKTHSNVIHYSADCQHTYQLEAFLKTCGDYQLVGHNFKFDMKHLWAKGYSIPAERWAHDTSLMGVASYEKVAPDYLDWYEARRKELNKGRTKAHRDAGQHSLKTMAPYFVGVEPFWEPENHDNTEYVLKDCEYTYRLYETMLPKLKEQGTYDFYEKHLMPWAKMFLEAETRGIQLDMEKVGRGAEEAGRRAAEVKAELDVLWRDALPAYQAQARNKLTTKYKNVVTVERHIPTEINLDSPTQLKWLLKDHLGLDIRDFLGKESTDKEVLERLAGQGREDVRKLLEYRKWTKLATTYYPSYKELSNGGVLGTSFNLDVARTGRTSSDHPNLQNQPKELHEIFIARPGKLLLTKDLESIEPALIAFYSEDEKLVKLIQDGLKFHAFNAAAVFDSSWDVRTLKKEHPDEYDAAKEFGLSILYGAGGRRVMSSALKRGYPWTEEQAKQVVSRLRANWPGVVAFKKWIDETAKREPISNLFGRNRSFINQHDDIYMKAFNGLIQGSGSDLLLESVVKSIAEFRERGIDAHFLMSVHDECVFEVPEDKAEICDEIVTRHLTSWKLETKWGQVPLRVEGKVSKTWAK